jgi:hypothetical protein
VKVPAIVTREGWRPYGGEAEEAHRKQKRGETVMLDCKRPRNLSHHNKYWTLIGFVHDNLPESMDARYPTPGALHKEMKLQAGHYDIHVTMGGKSIYIPKPTDFGAMGQDEFAKYYDAVLSAITRFVLPAITDDDLRDEMARQVASF